MNVKRNLLTSILLSTLIGAGVAGAADHSALVRQGFYGSQVQIKPDTVLRISSTTKFISVPHFAAVKIENDKSQSFVWQFDSAMAMSRFPLKTIAPGGFDAGNTYVNIIHPDSHYAQ